MNRLVVATVVVALAVVARRVDAYPQFQLSRDQTCTACHLSPAGGTLLGENGTSVAESMSQLGTPGEFMYGKLPLPGWLALGGDLRGAGGYFRTPQNSLGAFPMQADIYAAATVRAFSLHVTGGYRPTQWRNEGATRVWSREHYLQWQQKPGENEGVYVRVGRLMPVFGLRFAEHVDYNRRYGGTQLYSETYGAAVEYVDPSWEAHVTGFVKDPLIDTVEHSNGVAGYGEYRLDTQTQVGAEAMFTKGDTDKKIRGGVTAKHYFGSPDLLLQGELQYVAQPIVHNGYRAQLVGYLLATYFVNAFAFVDLGLGHYDENLRIKDLNRDAVDVNGHYFLTSHAELQLNLRYETIGLGKGGPSGGWALLQLHYRL